MGSRIKVRYAKCDLCCVAYWPQRIALVYSTDRAGIKVRYAKCDPCCVAYWPQRIALVSRRSKKESYSNRSDVDRLGYTLCKIKNITILLWWNKIQNLTIPSLVEPNPKPHDSLFGGAKSKTSRGYARRCWVMAVPS